MAVEISRQPSIDYTTGLLVAILMQIYNEKEQAEPGKIQNVQFEGKRGSGMELSSGLKEITSLEKSLMLSEKRRVGTSGQGTRLHPAKLPTCEKK